MMAGMGWRLHDTGTGDGVRGLVLMTGWGSAQVARLRVRNFLWLGGQKLGPAFGTP